MIQQRSVEELLKEVGAWQTGHFLLSSGLHSDQYVQCQKVLQYPRYGMFLAEAMVKSVLGAGLKPEAVVGPALGAVHWELLVALALDKAMAGGPVKGIFAERQEGSNEFAIRRGTEIERGEKVLVVEDVTTTGGSARQVVELVKKLGGVPAAVGAIVDRSGGAVSFGVPFFSLVRLTLTTHQPADCPMCKNAVPLVKPGSRRSVAAGER